VSAYRSGSTPSGRRAPRRQARDDSSPSTSRIQVPSLCFWSLSSTRSAAREGGGDVRQQTGCSGTAIAGAKSVNMPAGEKIDRAIKNGTGELPGRLVEEGRTKATARAAIAILIETLTDNRNRTTGEAAPNPNESRRQDAEGRPAELQGLFLRRARSRSQKSAAGRRDASRLVLGSGGGGREHGPRPTI